MYGQIDCVRICLVGLLQEPDDSAFDGAGHHVKSVGCVKRIRADAPLPGRCYRVGFNLWPEHDEPLRVVDDVS